MMRSRRFLLIASFICAAVITGCGPSTYEAATEKKEYTVARVLDGDTIELLNGKRVRYLSIDTPETRKRVGDAWKYDPAPFAVEAKYFNGRLVTGKRVILEFDQMKEDKFGRWLAYVYSGDKMINEELLRQGLATTYIIPPNMKHLDRLIDAQEEAKWLKRGLWSSIRTISPEEAGENIGQVCIVRGRVRDTYRTEGEIFLNFDATKGDSFTAVIFSSNIPFFEESSIFPASYYDKREVEVTGKIRYHNGPNIIVGHPSQIKVIE